MPKKKPDSRPRSQDTCKLRQPRASAAELRAYHFIQTRNFHKIVEIETTQGTERPQRSQTSAKAIISQFPSIQAPPSPPVPCYLPNLEIRSISFRFFQETKRPSKEMQVTIARQLGLDPSTVSNFFMNARRRSVDKWREDSPHSPNNPNNSSTSASVPHTRMVLVTSAGGGPATVVQHISSGGGNGEDDLSPTSLSHSGSNLDL